MSYILEALKRADADRKVEVATPAGRRPAVITTPRPLWPWLVGGGLVLNALVGGVVFLVVRGSSPAVSAPSPAGVERTEAVPEPPPAPPSAPPQRTAPVRSAETRPPAASTQPAAPAQVTVPPPANREPLARSQPEAKAVAAPPPPAASNLQERASKLKIEVLVWSDNPKERMVFLSGRKYVEGQTLTGGEVIEQIAQDGIVLVHEGQRARVRAETK